MRLTTERLKKLIREEIEEARRGFGAPRRKPQGVKMKGQKFKVISSQQQGDMLLVTAQEMSSGEQKEANIPMGDNKAFMLMDLEQQLGGVVDPTSFNESF